MFSKNATDKAKIYQYSALLVFSGFMLFTIGAIFSSNFIDLMRALNTTPSAPAAVWLETAFYGVILGGFWLAIFILFEFAKKGIVDLMHK